MYTSSPISFLLPSSSLIHLRLYRDRTDSKLSLVGYTSYETISLGSMNPICCYPSLNVLYLWVTSIVNKENSELFVELYIEISSQGIFIFFSSIAFFILVLLIGSKVS